MICERSSNSKLNDIDKNKYLIPLNLKVGQFIYVIRKRMKLSPEKAIFLFIDGKLLHSNSSIHEVYHLYRERDGFLYVKYSEENVFGN